MMKFLPKLTGIAAIVFFVAGSTIAQDIHFSQYTQAPLLLNPALAGLNTCDYRIAANFRMQWPTISSSGTYKTGALSGDMAIGKVTKFNSFAGIGLSAFFDQAGDLGFQSSRVDFSFAYHFMLDRKGTAQLSAGLQGAFNYRGINPSRATFDSQYDPANGTVDPNGARETLGRNRLYFGDAGLGILYSMMIKNKTNFYLGLSLNHLNQPKISFVPNGVNDAVTQKERLYMKTTIHTGLAIPVGKRIQIMPNAMALIQGPSYEFNVGCNVKSLVGNTTTSKTAVMVGAQYRGLLDALIILARVDIKGFSAGVSYDVNLSKLNTASSTVGGPEISLMYQGCYRKKPKPGHCPVM
jgi:type IX secretion system PorP/SprF family membrane protein